MAEATRPSLALAGMWEKSDYKGDKRIAFAILTGDPNDLMAPYHDRVPLAPGMTRCLPGSISLGILHWVRAFCS